MKPHHKAFLFFTPAVGLGLAAFAWIFWLKPLAIDKIKSEIQNYNQSQTAFNIQIESFDFSILALQASAKNINLSINESVEDSPTRFIQIAAIKAQVDPFDLIVGKFKVSYIQIQETEFTLIINSQSRSDEPLKDIPVDILFKWLPQIPLQKIVINKAHVTTILKPQNIRIESQIKNLTLKNLEKKLQLDVEQIANQFRFADQSVIEGHFTGQLSLDQKNLDIQRFKLFIDQQSSIELTGQIQQVQTALTNPQSDLKLKSEIKLESLRQFIYLIRDQNKRLPLVSGIIHMDGELKSTGFDKNSGLLKLQTQDVIFEHIKFGNAHISTQILNNDFKFNNITVEHPSGEARLSQVEISKSKPFRFKTKIEAEKFQLQKLFIALDEKDIPADLSAHAQGDCEGQIVPFNLECQATLSAQDIWVKTSLKDKKNLVALKKADLEGHLTMDTKSLQYNAVIRLPQSVIKSSGQVGFETGFDFKFNSDKLNLSDITDLAQLNLRGEVVGELNTHGDTSYGVIDSKIKAKSFVIDHFYVGDFDADLKYKNLNLFVNNIKGRLDKTLFNGDLQMDFSKEHLQAQFDVPQMRGQDIMAALEERFHLPLNLTGSGHAQVQLQGPLDFWKLQYDLTAQLNRGTINDESYNKIDLNLKADGDAIQFKKATLSKNNAVVDISGEINTEDKPYFDLNFKTRGYKFEDIDHFIQLFPNSTGNVTVNGKITESVFHPLITAQVSLKDFYIQGQPLPSSQGELAITLDDLRFNGQVFGRQSQSMIQIPLDDKKNYIFKAQLRDFNPLILLPLIKLPLAPQDTFASITADVDLHSEGRNLDALYGKLNLTQASLDRSQISLKLVKPAEFIFNRQLTDMTPLVMNGNDQDLKLDIVHKWDKKILSLSGKLNVRPLQFLLPFADNINGQLEFNTGLQMNAPQLNLFGEGSLKNASLSLKGFPYPIKEINSHFDFSQSKMLINEIAASLNQSRLVGQGQIDFKGSQNIDVNISATSDHVELEFPPQMQTAGIVNLKMTGHWIPYTLRVDYLIDQGFVNKEFTEQDQDTRVILQASKHLPPAQLIQLAPTLLLDINPQFPKGILIKNQIIEGVVTGQLNIQGSPEAPVMSGRVDFQPGSKLIFKDKPFEIQTGYVIFPAATVVNPEIFITANARVSDYDVNLLVQGPSKNLTIKPTSQPPLSESDLISLLALGYTNNKSEQVLSSDTQQKQTGIEVLAALSNQSKFNKKIQEKLGLNVQIAPSVDSTKNIAVPKVVVSKKLNKKINASYARPLSGDKQSNEVRLQWLFHPQFSLNLNYQNQTSEQETSIIQNNKSDQGNYGLDLEYKKEFK